MCGTGKTNTIDQPSHIELVAHCTLRFAALCLFAPCTMLQVTTNVDGANSTKPLLPAGAVHLVECLIGTLKKFKIKALGGLSKTHKQIKWQKM